jgi:hypothetical protein
MDALIGGIVHKLVILHFESLLPTNEHTINYRIPDPPDDTGPDYRFTLTPIQLGDHEHIQYTWFFSAHVDTRTYLDRELAQTAQLLLQHGYEIPGEIQMSRYVRVVDTEYRRELILFYVTTLSPQDDSPLWSFLWNLW